MPVSKQREKESRGRAGTILVVDDKQQNIRLLFEALEEAGYRILAATNGAAAISQAARAQPDLILMDVMMPGMDGFTACEKLKASPVTRNIPVLFMTALTETVDKLRGFHAGGVDYLTKPLQHEEVLARIRAHLGRHWLWREIDTYSRVLLGMGASDSPAKAWAALAPLIETNQDLAGLAFWQTPPDQTDLQLTFSTGFPEGSPSTWRQGGKPLARATAETPLLGEVFTEQEQLSAADRNTWPIYPSWAEQSGICGYIATPVGCRTRTYGVLFAGLARPVRIAFEEHRRWQRIIAQSFGAALFQSETAAAIRELNEKLERENESLRTEISGGRTEKGLIGQSPALRRVLTQAELVAPTDTAVLILGESGTGKELLAEQVHHMSPRAQGPLIRVNCAGIPGELFESEFFGHAKGAFTGAVRDRVGRFELADGGTLFLDEVGEIPMDLQGKLLRVLQEGTFERVGEETTRRTDVRLIAATNRVLHEAVKTGQFREDLYYRLSVFPLTLPPLRERADDIPALARHFAARSSRKMGRPAPDLPDALFRAWLEYSWPGNIRELENEIERALILSEGQPRELPTPGKPSLQSMPAGSDPGRVIPEAEWKALQRKNMIRALRKSDGRIDGPGGAAEQVGLRNTTFRSRMQTMKISKSEIFEPSS